MIRLERTWTRLVVAGGAALIAVALVAALSAPGPRHASVSKVEAASATTARPHIPTTDWEADPRVLDDTINHHEVHQRLAYIAEIDRQEKARAAKAAADEKARQERFATLAEAAGRSSRRLPADAEANRLLGQSMAAERGWVGDQWTCLDSLWGAHESSWNQYADNPFSSAYGIPQATPGRKMASAGEDWLTNPRTQITWGLNYIAGRYGTPCKALSFRKARGWY